VREATQDPLDHPESRVFQAELAKRVQREIPDHKDPLVKTVLPALEASLENEVFLEQRVLQV